MPESTLRTRAAVARGLGWLRDRLSAVEARVADGGRLTGFLRGRLLFDPRPDDVWIATYPRSGTTWMQFIAYLVVSDRSFDFAHVSEVTPWFERSLALGTRTAEDFAALPSPRVFKTHLRPEWVPAVGRVIYVEREGADVLASYYHFYRSHLGFEGDFDAFFERFMSGKLQYRSWFDHVAAWRRAAERRSVLELRYEAMRSDLGTTVDRVAEYLGVDLAASARAQVIRMASYEFMKAHESKFDPITEHLIDKRFVAGAFIRRGQTGDGSDRMSPAQADRFETRSRLPTTIRRAEHRLPDFLH